VHQGSLLLLYAMGAVVGSLLASATMRFTGPEGLFLYTSAIHVAMTLFTAHRMRVHARPNEQSHEPFADSLRIAQTVATLDPLGTRTERSVPKV
jgi:uncharacterized membrane protein YfcA